MKIVFFDGYCSLCNSFVDGLMSIDKRNVLKFASLQGDTAKRILGSQAAVNIDPDTVIYSKDSQTYERSSAILEIFWDLGGLWRASSVFFIFPKSFRDFIYGLVAKNRFRIFGRRETCRMPTPEEKEKLLP